jgi:hypothetical protein
MVNKIRYEIKTEFIQTGKKYDDSYGEDIPVGYIKQWIEIECIKELVDELEWVFEKDRQYLPTPRLDAVERILRDLKAITNTEGAKR